MAQKTIAEAIEAGAFGVVAYEGEKYALLGDPDVKDWAEMMGEEPDDDNDLTIWDVPEDCADLDDLELPEKIEVKALAVKIGEPVVDGKRTCYEVTWYLDQLDTGAPVACSRDDWQTPDKVEPFGDEPLNWPIPGQDEVYAAMDYTDILPILANKNGVFFQGVTGYAMVENDVYLDFRDDKDVFVAYALKIGGPQNEDGTVNLYEVVFDVVPAGEPLGTDIARGALKGIEAVGTTTVDELSAWAMPDPDSDKAGFREFRFWHIRNN